MVMKSMIDREICYQRSEHYVGRVVYEKMMRKITKDAFLYLMNMEAFYDCPNDLYTMRIGHHTVNPNDNRIEWYYREYVFHLKFKL